MNRIGFENASYMIGPEVEHTPAYSKKTLFVVGRPDVEQIERMAREYKTPHIFMGANHSFTCGNLDPYWNATITTLLDKGFWVTLDYEAHDHETVLKMLNPGIWQCRTFVPLLGVRIPKVQTSSPNLTVKIDDVDFNATNPGVWCLHHHELTDSNRFTGWGEYDTDEIVSPLASPAQTLPLKIAAVASIAVNEEGLKIKVTEPENTVSAVQNPQDLGLDPSPTSALKPENGLDADILAQVGTKLLDEVVKTPADAAEAYADGAGEKAAKTKAKAKK